jgi:hypothetical protein
MTFENLFVFPASDGRLLSPLPSHEAGDIAAVVHHFALDDKLVLVVDSDLHIVARNTLTGHRITVMARARATAVGSARNICIWRSTTNPA